MSILKKTILMVVCITIILFSLVYLASNLIYLKGFEDLERKILTQDIGRVEDAITVTLETLEAFCTDWAEWDDTYYFALHENSNYIERNLMDDTFINSEINIFIVLNNVGEMIYGKFYDLDKMEENAPPGDLPVFISSLAAADVKRPGEGISGIAVLSGQPALISCRPILTSKQEGPSAGYLVVGRYTGALFIRTLSRTTGLAISLLNTTTANIDEETANVLKELTATGGTYVETQKNNMIAGYGMVNDLSGNPAFIIKVTAPRDIFIQGIKAVAYLHASLFLIAIVLCVAFVFFFRKLIISRLTSLSNAVHSIGSRGEISNRVEVKGKDELSRLADNINHMLESLEKSEKRRQSQKEIIGNIITFTPNGVVAVNQDNTITLVNEAFRAIFDMKNRSLIGEKLEDLPELSEIAIEINNFRLSRMNSLKKELQWVRDGVKKIFIASFARLKEEEQYILYLTDISEERSKQESLYLTDRLASIGEMASGIAHELNNPLTSIIGLSEIVMRDKVPESVKEDMEMIKSESHRAAGIVRNLLSFARKNATFKQPANINAILNDVLRLRSYEHGVNNIKVIKEFDNELPDILVDHSQIQQVFINIILNAEYAMTSAHGKGTLRIKTQRTDDMVKISFTDDGPGIEPGNLRHIFDPFFTTKEAGKGTGLGLSISYGIIAAHNGQIYATSEYGKGATFTIELPLSSHDIKEAKQNA